MTANSTQFAGDCFTAQTISRHYGNNAINEDVGGLAVALSNIFINVTLPIVIYWSDKNVYVHTTVFMLLSQIYPILIATASSINSENLSLFDAHFATAVTASPISVYIAYSSIRDFVVGPNALFLKIQRGKKLIRLLGAALPFFWIAMNIITSFHPTAFRNSQTYCIKVPFSQWLLFQIVSNFVGVLDVMGRRDLWTDIEGRGGLGAVALVSLWIWAIYLVRHRFDILENMEYRRQHRLGRHPCLRSVLAILDVPFASWHVISNAHSWMRVDIVICLHWSWVLGIVKGMYLPDYEFSYGQIMSLFVIIPPFSATYDLIKTRQADIAEAIIKSPDYLMDGFVFLLLGRDNPWMVHPLRRIPDPVTTVDSKHLWLLRQSFKKLLYPASFCVTILDVAWIYGYVRAGSIPNPRTIVNDPHAAWKPFSVALYIYGYCVCCVNLLAWTHWLDKRMADRLDADRRSHPWSPPWAHNGYRFTIPYRIYCPLLTTCFIMGAFIMSAGPVFAPPAALPLAQQWQWSHFCSNQGFPSYAILDGSDYADLTSQATFYLNSQSNLTTYRYQLLESQGTEKTLLFYPEPANSNDTSSSAGIVPTYSVSYYSNDLFSVTCTTNHTEQCATGRHSAASTSSPLTIELNDATTNVTTAMSSVDRQWMFKDDAPSIVLSYLNGEGRSQSGLAPVVQTSVTERNHCELLKVCMSSETLDLPSVVAVGLILNAQQAFSAYCMQPRIFSI